MQKSSKDSEHKVFAVHFFLNRCHQDETMEEKSKASTPKKKDDILEDLGLRSRVAASTERGICGSVPSP